ncbi:MAG: hypothetical protein V1809_14115 [Planctomycetota bacterium]
MNTLRRLQRVVFDAETRWKAIKQDLPQYHDFLEASYLVLSNSHGQVPIRSIHIRECTCETITAMVWLFDNSDGYTRGIAEMISSWRMDHEMDSEMIGAISLMPCFVEVRFPTLKLEAIRDLKRHPLIQEASLTDTNDIGICVVIGELA